MYKTKMVPPPPFPPPHTRPKTPLKLVQWNCFIFVLSPFVHTIREMVLINVKGGANTSHVVMLVPLCTQRAHTHTHTHTHTCPIILETSNFRKAMQDLYSEVMVALFMHMYVFHIYPYMCLCFHNSIHYS